MIATTANARPEQVQMAFDAGVVSNSSVISMPKTWCLHFLQDDLVSKPFTVKQVMEKINHS